MVGAVLLNDDSMMEELTAYLNKHKDDWFGCTDVFVTCKYFSDEIIQIRLGREVSIALLDVLVYR